MASKGYVDQLLNALPSDLRYPLRSAFWHIMDNFRIATATRAENAQWYRVSATTHATANTEFAVAHGLSAAPTQLFQILDLTQINSQVVPLTVSRAPDIKYLYLKSSSTSAPFTMLVEP
jgi:hypothetical protein